MSALKICKPTTYTSSLYQVVFIGFFIAFLLGVYGLTVSVIDEIQRGLQLSRSLQDVVVLVAILVIVGSIVLGTLAWAMLFVATANITIHFSDQGFQITSPFLYKSKWLTWDHVVKVRSFSLHGGRHVNQIGINGLGWIFKLNGLLFWMYPHGAITIGEKGMKNGRELLRTLKQKRPDLFR